ncbi:hypothetical protein Pelo_7826 [Pelomyxa schiedti]|nr:hypothetical protein Pelo_7826 [Pelomyxa schiedti]
MKSFLQQLNPITATSSPPTSATRQQPQPTQQQQNRVPQSPHPSPQQQPQSAARQPGAVNASVASGSEGELWAQIRGLKQQLVAKQEALQLANVKMSVLQGTVETVTRDLNTLQFNTTQESVTLKDTVQQLSVQLADKDAENTELKKKVFDLASKLEISRQGSPTSLDICNAPEYVELLRKCESLEKSLSEARQEQLLQQQGQAPSDLDSRLSLLKRENENLESRMQILSREVATAREIRQNISSLKHSLDLATTELETLRNENTELKLKTATLSSDVDTLVREKFDLTTAKVDMIAAIEAMSVQLKEVTDERDQLKEQHDSLSSVIKKLMP